MRLTRLKELIEKSETIAAFARKYQLDASYLSQLLNGHRSFGEKAAANMAKKIGLNPRWFDLEIAFPEDAHTDTITLRQYHDAKGAMGLGVLLRDQPGQITRWFVTPEWLQKNLPANSGAANICIVTGFGDSMRGLYNSGDPLIIDTGIRAVDFDGVYFFRIGNEGFIKRLQRIPADGIRAISENKAYEAWTITPDMDFEVFGRVLKVWKSEGM